MILADASAQALALGLVATEEGGWCLLRPAAGGSFVARAGSWPEALERAGQPCPAEALAGPLASPCERCGAGPGQKCQNYRGSGCAPHWERGRPAETRLTGMAQRGLFD